MAVSSFVPEACWSCSVDKHKSLDRTDNGLTGLPGDSLCTHTQCGEKKETVKQPCQSQPNKKLRWAA